MIFELKHSVDERVFRIIDGESIQFQLHIHRAFEYFEQIEGVTEVTVGSRKYVLQSGEAVLIFPMQAHSYQTIEAGELRICIFSPDLVSEFYKKKESMLPIDNKMACRLPWEMYGDSHFHKKSMAYFICGEFETGREYAATSDKTKDTLLVSLLLYADKNYCKSCLLYDAAAEIGYDYAYVSKFFRRSVGLSFRQYVNNLRIVEAKRRLNEGSQSIEEIGASCGFGSLRSFDREFRAQVGISPSEYRRVNNS